MDEGSATVAKEALHNYKLDGENKIKVRLLVRIYNLADMTSIRSRSQGSESGAGPDSRANIRGYYCTMYFTLLT